MRILAAGDLHLGRSSSGLPESSGQTVDFAQAWSAIVEEALRLDVDLVCLSGDVVDSGNTFFPALHALRDGFQQLKDANIPTVAVAGNHDSAALPRLVDALHKDDMLLTLLGGGGNWQRTTIEIDGRPALHIDGWSFPAPSFRASPLDTYPDQPDDGVPVLGLVHGDLDVPDSKYAPLSRTELRSRPVSGWLLGHIHKPDLIADAHGPFILYPGSPQALDPGEQGAHGAWLIEFGAGTPIVTPRPLSTVRYDTLDIPMHDAVTADTLEGHFAAECTRAAQDALGTSGSRLEHLILRVALTGNTKLAGGSSLNQLCDTEDFALVEAGVHIHIERISDETLPAIDLHDYAQGDNPPAILARMLIALERGDDPADDTTRAALDAVRTALSGVRSQPVWHHDRDAQRPADHEPRDRLIHAARRLLTTLVEARQ